MSKRDVRLFLADILEVISQIEEFTDGLNEESFMKDKKTQKAVIRNLEIIGEASNNLDSYTYNIGKSVYNIPWRDVVDFRNKVTHDYFGVFLDEVWYVVTEELPSLKHQVKQLKEDIEKRKGK